MSKLTERLAIYSKPANGLQYAAIYDSLDDLIAGLPYMTVQISDGRIGYVQLNVLDSDNKTNGRVYKTTDQKIYQISSAAILPIDVTYSLDGKTFRDGGSFPGTSFVLGTIISSGMQKLEITYHYEYRANEPRGGTTGTRIAIGNVAGPTQVKSSKVSYNSFDATAIVYIGKGTFDVMWQGYKPKWHGMTWAAGWVKITNKF